MARGQQSAGVAALVESGAMPRHIGSWFEEFKDSANPFEPQSQRDDRRRVAFQGELGQIIGAVPGIELASVLLEEKTERSGIGRQTERTAAVSIMPEANSEIDPRRLRNIRAFVATAIGAKPNNVTVMDMEGYALHTGGGEDGTGTAEEDPYAGAQRLHEQVLTGKIKQLWDSIPGIKVQTTVVLEKELQTKESSVTFDPQKVVATKTEMSTVSERTTARGPGGRPGVVPNAVVSNQQAAVTQEAGTESDKTHESETQQSLASYNQETRTIPGMTPVRHHRLGRRSPKPLPQGMGKPESRGPTVSSRPSHRPRPTCWPSRPRSNRI